MGAAASAGQALTSRAGSIPAPTDPLESLPIRAGRPPAIGNDFHYQVVT